jgi:hypothetical protein
MKEPSYISLPRCPPGDEPGKIPVREAVSQIRKTLSIQPEISVAVRDIGEVYQTLKCDIHRAHTHFRFSAASSQLHGFILILCCKIASRKIDSSSGNAPYTIDFGSRLNIRILEARTTRVVGRMIC